MSNELQSADEETTFTITRDFEMTGPTFFYRGYCGSIEESRDDHCFHGQILLTRDLVTYEASEPDGLEAAFIQAVDYYLDKCAREGLLPDQPNADNDAH